MQHEEGSCHSPDTESRQPLELRQAAAMDYAACQVVFVDKRASKDLEGKYIPRPAAVPLDSAASRKEEPSKDRASDILLREIEEVRESIQSLLAVFDGGVYSPPHFAEPRSTEVVADNV